MIPETTLSARMRALAKDRTDLPENWLEQADAFDIATQGFYGEPQIVSVKQFLGVYARTRRMWCEATGEPLV